MAGARELGFLVRFLICLEIDLFEVLEDDEQTIRARINFHDPAEDSIDYPGGLEEVRWEIPENLDLGDALDILEYADRHELLRTDWIHATEETLARVSGWPVERVRSALEALLTMEVALIQDGEVIDHFFIQHKPHLEGRAAPTIVYAKKESPSNP